MAKCEQCQKEMTRAASCTFPFVKHADGTIYKRITVNNEIELSGRCHDCGIELKEGNIHHHGCDMEVCPKCGGQFAFCNCAWEQIAKYKCALKNGYSYTKPK